MNELYYLDPGSSKSKRIIRTFIRQFKIEKLQTDKHAIAAQTIIDLNKSLLTAEDLDIQFRWKLKIRFASPLNRSPLTINESEKPKLSYIVPDEQSEDEDERASCIGNEVSQLIELFSS